ncbi:unnamed protein product, partial [Prorocentrum cordatum]
ARRPWACLARVHARRGDAGGPPVSPARGAARRRCAEAPRRSRGPSPARRSPRRTAARARPSGPERGRAALALAAHAFLLPPWKWTAHCSAAAGGRSARAAHQRSAWSAHCWEILLPHSSQEEDSHHPH